MLSQNVEVGGFVVLELQASAIKDQNTNTNLQAFLDHLQDNLGDGQGKLAGSFAV